MAWSDDITGELPAQRDDEPEHLRQNTADELSDHLRCALNRELHVTQNEQQAKQNVLSRFGNVNRIARKLWFDWMKEKIMTQRLNLAMTSLMTVVCIVLCFFVWNVSVNSREAMQTSQQLSRRSSRGCLWQRLCDATEREHRGFLRCAPATLNRLCAISICV